MVPWEPAGPTVRTAARVGAGTVTAIRNANTATATIFALGVIARSSGRYLGSRTSIRLMRIALASDHAGFRYKERLKGLLAERGHEAVDFGTHSEESVDYPLFIRPAAEAVAAGECERGIVLGGSGNGEAMAANRVRGVRCALCWSRESAELARRHHDANVLSLGERLLPGELVVEIVDVWLATPFDGGRHARRIAQLD